MHHVTVHVVLLTLGAEIQVEQLPLPPKIGNFPPQITHYAFHNMEPTPISVCHLHPQPSLVNDNIGSDLEIKEVSQLVPHGQY